MYTGMKQENFGDFTPEPKKLYLKNPSALFKGCLWQVKMERNMETPLFVCFECPKA